MNVQVVQMVNIFIINNAQQLVFPSFIQMQQAKPAINAIKLAKNAMEEH